MTARNIKCCALLLSGVYLLWLLIAWTRPNPAPSLASSPSEVVAEIGRNVEVSMALERMPAPMIWLLGWLEPDADRAIAEGIERVVATASALETHGLAWTQEAQDLSVVLVVLRDEQSRRSGEVTVNRRELPAALDQSWVWDLAQMRLGEAHHDQELAASSRERLIRRGWWWVARAAGFFGLHAIVLGTAAWFVGSFMFRHDRRSSTRGGALIPPPWSIEAGLLLFFCVELTALAMAGLTTFAADGMMEQFVRPSSLEEARQWVTAGRETGAIMGSVAGLALLAVLGRRVLLNGDAADVIRAGGFSIRWPKAITCAVVLVGFAETGDLVLSWLGPSVNQVSDRSASGFNGEQGSLMVLPALAILSSCVLAPIIEEASFRGLLYSSLRSRSRPLLSVVGSAAVFAFAHVGDTDLLLANFWFGTVMAVGYEVSRSLVPVMLAHALYSAMLYGSGIS